MMNCCIVPAEAETLYNINEVQPMATRTAVCFSITNFSTAPHAAVPKETNAAAVSDSFKGR